MFVNLFPYLLTTKLNEEPVSVCFKVWTMDSTVYLITTSVFGRVLGRIQ